MSCRTRVVRVLVLSSSAASGSGAHPGEGGTMRCTFANGTRADGARASRGGRGADGRAGEGARSLERDGEPSRDGVRGRAKAALARAPRARGAVYRESRRALGFGFRGGVWTGLTVVHSLLGGVCR